MKKITYILACVGLLGLSSCQGTFLDLDPLDAKTDAVYFKTPEHFREYANGFYGQLIGWQSKYGSIFEHMDCSSDLFSSTNYSAGLGKGAIAVSSGDGRWDNCYGNIRSANNLFERAQTYPGSQEDIKIPLAEAHFFRAYSYFYLLKFFGGVPIVTKVLDVDSPELMGKRSSRYEVVDFILSDLTSAIAGLPEEQSISATDKGRISKQAAKAYKARVLLYEATWRKYNGTKTDYEGSAGPAGDLINAFLENAISLSEDVMKDNSYELWNYNSDPLMKNQSNRYLFNIDLPSESNPINKGKDSNKEFIISSIYDRGARKGGIELTRIIYSDMRPSRKMVDMFVCTDGLPANVSSLFKGYKVPGDEFQNRDYRLTSYIMTPNKDANLTGSSGYGCYKFAHDKQPEQKMESANYPVMRLAEVYLNYAEAVMERYGQITDPQLDNSINKLRVRAGVAKLTNALVAEIKTLSDSEKSENEIMLDEIRRERAVELFMEGFRFDDLKRWGIAEESLNASRCGMVVGNSAYSTVFVDESGNATGRYNKNVYTAGEETVETAKGELPCVVLLRGTDCVFSKKNYLWPIPQRQRDLNPNLVQNPGY